MDETRGIGASMPFRQIEIARDGPLLSARQLEYRIDRWDPATGKLLPCQWALKTAHFRASKMTHSGPALAEGA